MHNPKEILVSTTLTRVNLLKTDFRTKIHKYIIFFSRTSFINVTADAMHRQRSLRLHNNPWEYRNRISQKRRRTMPNRSMNSAELNNLRQNISDIIYVNERKANSLDNEVQGRLTQSVCIEMNHQQDSIKEEDDKISDDEEFITYADTVI